MKTKILTVTLKDGNRSDDLLVTDMGVIKDIVKDILSSIPNILPLEIGRTPVINESYLDGRIEGTRVIYHVFDMYRMNHEFMSIVKTESNFTNESEERVPIIEYIITVEKDDAFAESIFLMIENYYRGKSSAKCERSELNELKFESIGILDNTEHLDIFKDLHPAVFHAFKDGFPTSTIGVSAYSFNSDHVETLNEKKIIDQISEIIRSKYSVVIPVDSKTIENEENDGVRKTFVDTYDVYAMDTTIGKLFSLVSCTSSTIGNDSGERSAPVQHSAVILWNRYSGDYAKALGREITSTFINVNGVGCVVTEPV